MTPVLSAIFESPKGESVYGKRTICEVHRELFDRLVLGLTRTNPELLRDTIRLLEEAYIMGVRMNAKLIEHADGNDEWSGLNVRTEELVELRRKRRQVLAENRAFLASLVED